MRAVLLAASVAGLLSAQKVDTRDNNVFFTGAGGQRMQLTSGNRDLFPVLSPDARWAAFIRISSEVPEGNEINAICVVAVRMGEPAPNCSIVRYQPGEAPLAGFSRPVWSEDGRHVYFRSDFSAATDGLCRFDTATGTAEFLSPVNAVQDAGLKKILERLR
jgi:hypothetical protein